MFEIISVDIFDDCLTASLWSFISIFPSLTTSRRRFSTLYEQVLRDFGRHVTMR